MSLHLDFVGRDAAAFAVKRWHYSRSMPSGRLVCIGAWENGAFIGALVFGRGASSEIGSPFELRQDRICELCRIALAAHQAPVSRILSIAIRLLRRQSPNLKAIISYSDPEFGHDGRGVYAACGWWFIGRTNAESLIQLGGKLHHPRTISSRYHTRSIDWLRQHVAADAAHVRTRPKFRYLLVLDDETRRRLEPRRLPYPKREQGAESGAPRSRRGSPSLDGAQRRGPCDGICSLSPVAEARHV